MSSNTSDIPRELVIGIMKLISIHTFSSTPGFRLEFYYPERDVFFVTKVFEGSHLFERMRLMKRDRRYVVVALNIKHSKVLEMLDIN